MRLRLGREGNLAALSGLFSLPARDSRALSFASAFLPDGPSYGNSEFDFGTLKAHQGRPRRD